MFLVGFWGALPGCKGKPVGPGEWAVWSHVWSGSMVPAAAVREKVERELAEIWSRRERPSTRGKCRLELLWVVDQPNPNAMIVTAGAIQRCSGPDKKQSLVTNTPMEPMDRMDLPGHRELVEKGRLAQEGLLARMEVQQAGNESIPRSLESESGERVSQAIAECVLRRMPTCLPGLREQARGTGIVASEAIGAIGILGRETELSFLAELTGSQDPEILLSALYGIRNIGGPRGRRYLEGIAAGHALTGTRELATRLLREWKGESD